MLNIITGAMESDKSEVMLKQIVDAVNKSERVIIIIPDQFSFEYDKKLYKALGARLFNFVSVISFNKVSQEILKKYGSEKGEYADELTKQIMMYLAVKKFKGTKASRYYVKQLDKPNFIVRLLDFVKDLRQASISAEDFQTASLSVNGTLAEKVGDLQQIYPDYCEILSERGLKDSLTAVGEASEIALNNNYFKDSVVFIDEFSGFSFDELKMLAVIISQAKSVSASLTINEATGVPSKINPFENVIVTKQQLAEIAKNHNVPVGYIKCTAVNKFKADEIEFLSNHIFCPGGKKCKTHNNVEIISANDLYEEIEFVAAEARRLVCDNGYRFSDIAVVSRQLCDYSNIIRTTFERYEIPYFMDSRQPVSQKALVLYIMSIFEAVTSKSYNTEAILRYMKSILSKYNDFQISNIENYCYQWNVKGDMWLSEFTAQDKTVHIGSNEDSELSKINMLREDIIAPLEKFKKSSKNASATHICEAFFCLLKEISVTEIVAKNIEELKNSSSVSETDAIEIAREFKQLWSVIVSSVRSIYDNLGESRISLKEFYELFKLMISQATVATPPEKLDAVTIASAERSRLAEPKVVFVIGVNEGIMPFNVKEDGLFTDKDKDILGKSGLNISKKLMWRISEEKFFAYKALSAPSARLYVTYSASDSAGKARRPSLIISQINAMFDSEISSSAAEKGAAYYCKNNKSAFFKFIEKCNIHTAETASIYSVLKEIPYYKEKIEYLNGFSETPFFKLSQKNSQGLFFQKDFSVSATRLEDYFKCPFSFFCKYGLKLFPLKTVEISPVSRGTIVHYCLESILSIADGNGNKHYNIEFTNYSDEELKTKISALLVNFRENELGGDFGKTARFNARFNKLQELVFEIVKNIQSEFKQSRYVPSEFEFSLTDEKGKSILEIKLDDDVTIRVSGKIDRVDTFDEKKMLRIVDYKTGTKELLFEEIYHGINLQMILYLLALTQGNSEASKYSEYEPAGVLYFPATQLKSNVQRAFNLSGKIEDVTAEVTKNKLSNFKMKGLIVENAESIEAMEAEVKGEYIPVKASSKGYNTYSKLIDTEAYKKLEEFALGKVTEMAEKVRSGEIQAVPTFKDKMPCEYCEYWSVCGSFKTDKAIKIQKADKTKLEGIIGVNKDIKAGETDE